MNCFLCDEPLSPRSRLSMCPNCRAHMGRWRVRPVGHRLKYSDALKLRTKRMETLVDIPRKGTIERESDKPDSSKVVDILSRRKVAS